MYDGLHAMLTQWLWFLKPNSQTGSPETHCVIAALKSTDSTRQCNGGFAMHISTVGQPQPTHPLWYTTVHLDPRTLDIAHADGNACPMDSNCLPSMDNPSLLTTWSFPHGRFSWTNLPWNKMEQLNACCMYLQVTTLAEAEIMDHSPPACSFQCN